MYYYILFYLLSVCIVSFFVIHKFIKDDEFYGGDGIDYIILFLLLFGYPITTLIYFYTFVYEEKIWKYMYKLECYISDYKEKRKIRLRRKYVRQLKWN